MAPVSVQIPQSDAAARPVRVVQLTDTHLCQRAGGRLIGMDTDHSLQSVIRRVLQEQSEIDLVLGTGDLSDKGAREAYERLEDYFSTIPAPSFWLPGNHDDGAQMRAAARSDERLAAEVLAGPWQILLLDSQVAGQVGGRLGADELARLETALQRGQAAGKFALVCLHHQPVEVGCQWLDEQMVADAEAFWSVLDRFAAVRGVLWGHVHQEVDYMRGKVRLMASPSTCVQFAPGCADFQADDRPPGYRWLALHGDGRLETGVSRVTDEHFPVDLDSGGYL